MKRTTICSLLPSPSPVHRHLAKKLYPFEMT
jgi:hypothetical protein